ncbi:MAG: FAD-dependent oxidoreductase [Caulobacteraceae bacterium]|nr:FAD-dependent oxidoreductase [Caulobacteraceae bacterium]
MVKVVIVGGGALGAAAAFALAEAGCEVVVVDAAGPPNASAVAAGMLAPAMEAALDRAATAHAVLLRRARAAWPDFARRAGIVLVERGAWALGSAGFVAGVRARLDGAGFAVGGQGLAEARDAVRGLAEGLEDAVFSPDDAVLDAPLALAALKAAVQARGGRWLEGVAEQIVPGGVRTSAGELACDRLILATGFGQGLAPETAQLAPIKGHILTAEGFAYDGPVLRGEGVYVAPAAGAVRIGATMEAGVSDLAVSPAAVAALRAAAARLLPALAEVPVTVRTGVRAATPDDLPWVGPAADGATLLAVGARRNGWLLAPLVAEALTAWVLGEAPPPGLEALSPLR